MRFCIRVDDVGLLDAEAETPSGKAYDGDCAVSRRFHDALQGLPYLAAVVPAALDGDGRKWIRERPHGMTVAAHGFDHDASTRDEMHGLSVAGMRDRIARARDVLGPGVACYVPPFNAFESGLAEACWHEGIRSIWGLQSRWPTPPQPWPIYRDLVFVPAWDVLYGATRWEQSGQRRLLTMINYGLLSLPGIAVLTMHTTWEMSRDPEFKGVRELVGAIRDHVITPDAYLQEARNS